jgi:exopolyphosphatase/guanosine-5'-triphosphate,3'-diphosphate pyrophosphatase
LRAVVDIGSHSVLLLAAEGSTQAPLTLAEEYRITALGADMGRTGSISRSAAIRTRFAIEACLERCRALGIHRLLAVGTSALREANNREEVLSILSGPDKLSIRVLSEQEEAELTRRGALSGLDVGTDAMVCDLGGRSTEVSAPGFLRSFALGCQRATEAYLHGDPPGEDELARLHQAIDAWLQGLPAPKGELVCSGGTATTLANIDLALPHFRPDRVHGHRLGCRRLAELAQELATMPEAQRRRLPGMEPDRAGVLPAGAIMLESLCRWHPAGCVVVSARGLCWGVWLTREMW